jgi:hypothetical protein
MPTPQRFKCDQCGTIGEWSDSWAWFGSIALAEEAPQHIIHVCSPRCAATMKANMDAGNVKQPVAKPRGYYCKVVGARKGY